MNPPTPLRYLRLGSGAVVVSRDGVILRSPSGTLALDGTGIATLAERLIDALTGARARSDVLDELDPVLRAHGQKFLDLLTRLSLTIEPPVSPATPQLTAWQAVYARLIGEPPDEARRRLSHARVLFVGLESWAVFAAQHLAHAGLPVIHVTDDAMPRVEDPSQGARPRSSALAEMLLDIAPSCAFTHSQLAWTSDGDLVLPSRTWSVVVDAMPATSVSIHRRLARFAHRNLYTTIFSAVDGAELIVGPITVPHQTACWECYYRRRLSNCAKPWVAPALHRLLGGDDSPSSFDDANPERICPPSAPSMLGHLVAEEVLKTILFPTAPTLRGRVAVHNLVNRESSSHTILPAARCDVCGGAESVADHHDPPQNPFDAESVEDLLRRAQGIVDSRTGIISAIALRIRRADEPVLPMCAHACVAGHTDGVVHEGRNDGVGGKGLTAVEAMIGAVGEALERYSASIVDERLIVEARRAELHGDVVDPANMPLYPEHQYRRPGFPYQRYCPDRKYPWVRGRWLDDHGAVWVPALLAYFVTGSGETNFCQVTSNGLATGAGYDDAALRASLELIERDAFMQSWTCRRPGIRLRRDKHLQLETLYIVESLERLGARIELYLLKSRVDVPVVLCLGLGDGRHWPGVSVTTAAHWNPQQAAHKAVVEHGYSCVYVRRAMLDNTAVIPRSAEDVRTFLDHALYYVPVERQKLCEFWRSSRASSVSIGDAESWEQLDSRHKARELVRRGMNIAIVDVTSPDVKLTGLRVVRAICEDAHPLYCGVALQRTRERAERGDPDENLHPMG